MELRPRTEGLPEGAPEVPASAAAQAARALARRLRSDGVLAVAAPALGQARPAGVDLVGALRVLLLQLAQEWRAASDVLPVLDADRLQLHSASALITQGAQAAEPLTTGTERLDRQELGRAAALRAAVLAPEDGRTLEEGNVLLDRTWAVLTDVRRHAAGDAAGSVRAAAVVPSAAQVDADDTRRLPPSLQDIATTGALVGLLLPWLPPARLDPLARVDAVLNAVSALARCNQDDEWWFTMTTVGRCTSQVAVAVALGVATSEAPPALACAGVLAEPAVSRLVDEALAAATRLAPEAAATTPAEGIGMPRAGGVPLPPQPSPSQQARAAAERAAAERAANQQAWMERMRTKVMGAGAPEAPAAAGTPETVTLPPSQPGPVHDTDDEDGPSDESIHLGIWDTLMGPR